MSRKFYGHIGRLQEPRLGNPVLIVIPVEIGSPSYRVSQYDPNYNNEGISLCLDLLQERRDDAQAVDEAYRARIPRYYNKTVNPRKFRVGDWVLRKLNVMTRDFAEGKLNAK
jgi:hypothetical protein